MKKLLGILVLGLLFSGSTYANEVYLECTEITSVEKRVVFYKIENNTITIVDSYSDFYSLASESVERIQPYFDPSKITVDKLFKKNDTELIFKGKDYETIVNRFSFNLKEIGESWEFNYNCKKKEPLL